MRFKLTDAPQNRLLPLRHPAEGIYPAQLIEWMWLHKHPRIETLGIECNRWGERHRRGDGLDRRGTTYWVTNGERDWGEVIGCNSIPYDGRKDATWDVDSSKWVDGELVRGWRLYLAMLAANGILYPSHDLSYLIGENSWDRVPRRYWE